MTSPIDPAERLLPRLPAGRAWIPAHHGESGDRVYRRDDGTVYAKLARGPRASLLEEECQRTRWLAAFDIGAAPVLDWIASDDAACMVIGALPGVPACDLSLPDLLDAWPSIVRRLKRVHALPVDDCPFERTLSALFDRAEDVVARGAVNPDFLRPEQAGVPPTVLLDRLRTQLPERLAQERNDRVVCHGDACLPNFMIDPGTLRCTGLIDVGRLGVADRHVDLSLLLANAGDTWDNAEQARIARDRLFDLYDIAVPDQGRLDFYLELDPLTWG